MSVPVPKAVDGPVTAGDRPLTLAGAVSRDAEK
jgi:hypothetical protein